MIIFHTSREGAEKMKEALQSEVRRQGFILDEVGQWSSPKEGEKYTAWWENPDSKTAKVWKETKEKMNKKNKKYKKYSKQ